MNDKSHHDVEKQRIVRLISSDTKASVPTILPTPSHPHSVYFLSICDKIRLSDKDIVSVSHNSTMTTRRTRSQVRAAATGLPVYSPFNQDPSAQNIVATLSPARFKNYKIPDLKLKKYTKRSIPVNQSLNAH